MDRHTGRSILASFPAKAIVVLLGCLAVAGGFLRLTSQDKPGKETRLVRPVALNDLAPSLATLLNVETPSGSVGRPLYEMLADAAD